MILAVAAIAAAFVPLASADVVLQNGVPETQYVGKDSSAFFSFPLTEKNKAVRVTVTAGSGDPDMYLGCSRRPTWVYHAWQRTEVGNDTISITPADLSNHGCNSDLYISVTGAGSTAGQSAPVYFSIVAYFQDQDFAVTLNEGQAQGLVTNRQSISYAKFVVPAAAAGQSATFTLATIIGSGAELYVMKNPANTPAKFPVYQCNKYYGSTGLCAEVEVKVGTYSKSTNDPDQSPGSVTFPSVSTGETYIVALISTTGAPIVADVSVEIGSEAVPLELGVPEYFNVLQYLYQQTSVVVSAPSDQASPEIVFNVHPVVGRSGLYVSETASPSNTSHTWGSSRGLADAQVVIPFAELSATCRAAIANNGTCKLYAAIQAVGPEAEAIFEVYATVSGSAATPIMLTPGSSVNLDLAPRTYGYVLSKLQVPFGQPGWTISFETLAGWGDAFVVLGNNRRFYPGTSADVTPKFVGGQAIARFEPEALSGLAAHRCVTELLGRSDASTDGWAGRPEELKAANDWAALLRDIPSDDPSVPCPPNAPSAVVAGAYCSNCEVRITMFSGIFGSDTVITLIVDNSTELTSLSEGEPMPGEVGAYAYDYYDFTVDLTSPLPITFTLEKLSGDPDIFVSVRDASRPNFLPSANDYTWASISLGNDLLVIDPTHPSYVSKGTYLIAVYGASMFGVDSRYTLTARSASANTVNPLPPGEDVSISISPHSYAYFMFNPCADNTEDDSNAPAGCSGSVDAVFDFAWSATRGDVNVYITNSYHPGSSPSMLPFAGNPKVTLWSYNNGERTASIGPKSPGYDSNKNIYTIGIQSTSNLGVTATIRAVMESPDVIDIVRLDLGETSGPYSVPAGTNSYFAFDYGDANVQSDFFVGVALEKGSVSTVIAPPNRFTGQPQDWAPRCTPNPHMGTTPICMGYVFRSKAGGDSSIGISHDSPCNPFDGPTVASNCSVAMFRTGTWLATVYAEVETEFTITVSVGDDHIELAENEEQEAATISTAVCKDRDTNSEVCPKTSPNYEPVFAAWFTTELPVAGPGTGSLEDVQFKVERDCGGLFGCGAELQLYAVSCFEPGTAPKGLATCNALSPYPTAEYHQLHSTIRGASGALAIPGDATCGPYIPWNDGQFANDDDGADDDMLLEGDVAKREAVKGDFGAQNCRWYFSVFHGRTATSPGTYSSFKVTLSASNDNSVEVIGTDDTKPGTTYTSRRETLDPDAPTKYYDVFFDQTGQTAVRATAYACSGKPTLYACEPGSGCADQRHPGPGTNGASQVAQYDPTSFTASLSFTKLAGGELNLAAAMDASSSTPSFQIQLVSGSGPVLYGPRTVSAAFSPQQSLEIEWEPASIFRFGRPIEKVYSTVATVVVFSTSTIPAGAVLGTECGINAAYSALKDTAKPERVGALSLPYRRRMDRSDQFLSVTGLKPTGDYTVAVIVECDSSCMPDGAPVMLAAAAPVKAQPQPSPSASPSPGSAPSPDASASPAPGANGDGPDGGAIAGGVIGALVGVAAAGGLFVWYRRRSTGPGDEMGGYYTSAD